MFSRRPDAGNGGKLIQVDDARIRSIEKLETVIARTAEDTFELGRRIGSSLKGGELILLTGPLGAGKTIAVKGIMSALGLDPNEVTSPSFTLVNLYNAGLDVYHIDLWRLDGSTNAAVAVGLDDILANDKAVVIIEWAEKLGDASFDAEVIRISIEGDGDEPRKISVQRHQRA
jgi:tRNA threonylcarbamoyladenosine biosynthesis protein TsaE